MEDVYEMQQQVDRIEKLIDTKKEYLRLKPDGNYRWQTREDIDKLERELKKLRAKIIITKLWNENLNNHELRKNRRAAQA
jgi:hypothetical protein